jgi:hypothetical protein
VIADATVAPSLSTATVDGRNSSHKMLTAGGYSPATVTTAVGKPAAGGTSTAMLSSSCSSGAGSLQIGSMSSFSAAVPAPASTTTAGNRSTTAGAHTSNAQRRRTLRQARETARHWKVGQRAIVLSLIYALCW